MMTEAIQVLLYVPQSHKFLVPDSSSLNVPPEAVCLAFSFSIKKLVTDLIFSLVLPGFPLDEFW